MRRAFFAAAVFAFAASCGTIVHHDLTLTFDESGERVTVAIIFARTSSPAAMNGACALRTRIRSRTASCSTARAVS
jgi:hypothetical protein